MGKFTAADVVRRWNPDAKNSTEAMRSRLSTILGKAKKLPEEEDLLRSWGEKMRRLYRLEWGRDMDEVARIGVLESGALEDADVARLYGEVIAALPRALPMMRRMGYAEPKVPLGRAAPGEELGSGRESETGGPRMDEAEREERIMHPVEENPGRDPAAWPIHRVFAGTPHRVTDVMGRYYGGAEIDELVEEFPGILPEQLEEYVRRRAAYHQGGLYQPEIDEIRGLAEEGLDEAEIARRTRKPRSDVLWALGRRGEWVERRSGEERAEIDRLRWLRRSRYEGAVAGLAVGDALGATYEFCGPDEVPEGPLGIVGGGWLSLGPGETTDDTALARCVLEGYEADGRMDLGRIGDAMLRWFDSDPPDVGNQTRYALGYLRAHPEAARLPDDPEAQGNGAVMRAAAHGVGSWGPEEAARNAFSEAALTHPSREARASSALVAALVALMAEDPNDPVDPAGVLEAAYGFVEGLSPGAAEGKRLREVLRPLEGYRPDAGGWTVYTTRLALRAFLDARGFREGVERVVRLGGDADTNAAVAGALLGARFGRGAIPDGWSGAVPDAAGLSSLVERVRGERRPL